MDSLFSEFLKMNSETHNEEEDSDRNKTQDINISSLDLDNYMNEEPETVLFTNSHSLTRLPQEDIQSKKAT